MDSENSGSEKPNMQLAATKSLSAENWDDPSNAENPLNWRTGKKWYHTAIPSLFALVVTLASSIYIPAIREIQQKFHVSTTVSLLPYSFYVLGQALGPVLAAPLSETFGRRGTYIPYVLLYALFILGSGFSHSIASLTICRLFAGVFGSPVLSVGGGTIADVWAPQDRGIPMALLVLVPFLGPSLGPLIGSYTVQAKGWRWTQWVLLFITVAAGIFAVGMKETYKKVLLSRRPKKFGKPSQPENPRSISRDIHALLTATLFRPWRMFFTEPIVGAFAFYVGFNFAIYYSFFAALPYVFLKVYDFDLSARGLVFLGLAVGNMAAFCMVVALSRMTYATRIRAIKSGTYTREAPEKRLLLALIGSLCGPVSLFWFGWSAKARIHWVCPIVALGFFAFGNYLIFMAYSLYMFDVYGASVGASATATVAVLRSLLGAAFPLFTIQMYERLGIDWATSLLGFIVLLLSVVPWALYRFGPLMRERSNYPTQ